MEPIYCKKQKNGWIARQGTIKVWGKDQLDAFMNLVDYLRSNVQLKK